MGSTRPHTPELLILDEPTSGVDPLARSRLWDTIHEQADRGVGVLVTTHYMQEADQCDRLVIMVAGRVAAAGTILEIHGGRTAVQIDTESWEQAFRALSNANMPVLLAGRSVRVANTPATRPPERRPLDQSKHRVRHPRPNARHTRPSVS